MSEDDQRDANDNVSAEVCFLHSFSSPECLSIYTCFFLFKDVDGDISMSPSKAGQGSSRGRKQKWKSAEGSLTTQRQEMDKVKV